MTTRRDFLKLLGVGTAGATLSAAGLYLPEAEPVRRYWQVGANLSRPSTLAEYYRDLASGILSPLSRVVNFGFPSGLSPHPDTNRHTDENGRFFSHKEFMEAYRKTWAELHEVSILAKAYQDSIMASWNSKS